MAKIFEGIDGYAEMTAEQKLEALESLETPTLDDSEIKKWKAQFDKASHENAEYKKANKALQEQINSKLSADEIAEAQRQKELEDIIAERDALKREATVNKRVGAYLGLGYSEEMAMSSAKTTINMTDDEFATMIDNSKAFKTGYEQSLRKEIVGGNPKPDGKGSTPKTITKEDFSKMSYSEKLELYNNDKAKYDELANR